MSQQLGAVQRASPGCFGDFGVGVLPPAAPDCPDLGFETSPLRSLPPLLPPLPLLAAHRDSRRPQAGAMQPASYLKIGWSVFPTIYLISCRGGEPAEESIEVQGSSRRVNTGEQTAF